MGRKKYGILLTTMLIVSFALIACNNGTTETRSIPSEYRGKWQTTKMQFAGDDTIYTIPFTIEGVSILSHGYEVGDNFVKFYSNGSLQQILQNLYLVGNSVYDSSGPNGATIQVSGDDLILTDPGGGKNYCKKVTKFSWE